MQQTNQNSEAKSHVADAKGGKTSANASRLVLVLPLLLSQSRD